MDLNNCSTNDSEAAREFLQQLVKKSDTAMIPAVVMLVIFSVVGLAGNILVLVVYSKKVQLSPTKVLIMTIATFDLVANVGAIPTEIIVMFGAWNLRQRDVCKVTASLGSFTVVGAALCLVTVAVIRFRKVCRPYGWQVTIKQAVIASLINVLLALIFSIPYMVISGVKARPTSCANIKGHDCFADDLYAPTIWPKFNNILFVVLYLVLSASMVALYTLIGIMAWKHSKLHGTSAETSKEAVSYNSTSQLSSSVTAPLASQANTSTEQINTSQGYGANRSSHGCLNTIMFSAEHHTRQRAEDNSISSTICNPIAMISMEPEDTSKDDYTQPIIATTKEIDSPSPSTRNERINHISCTKQAQNHDHQLQPTFPAIQNNTAQLTLSETELSLNNFSNGGDIQHRSNPHTGTPTKDSNPKRSSRMGQVASSLHDPIKTEKPRLPVGRITAMLIIISAIYVLGFLPFLILAVYENEFPDKNENLNHVELAVFNLFYRLYFLQSATNPIVYSLCDTNFCRNCIQLLTCKRIRHL